MTQISYKYWNKHFLVFRTKMLRNILNGKLATLALLFGEKKKRSRRATRFIYRHDVDFYLIWFFLCSTCDAILKSWITSEVHVRCDFFFFSFFLTCCCLFPSSFYAPGAPVALPRRARFHRVFNCFLFSPFGWYPVLSSFSCPIVPQLFT